MKLSLSASERALRDEVRTYLDEHAPGPDDLPADLDGYVDRMRAWQRDAHRAGLVGLSWPREYGGRGASLSDQLVANAEMARAGVPQFVGYVGIDVIGPTILDHGTERQKTAHLPRILSGEDIWCQGFSEPEAGSDLASLRTRAVPDGDGFRLQGQKVWTSYAQYAQWCAVLARTDPDVPAHRGISYLLVDMSSPGVTASPLVMSTGDAEFGEVFFDDVFVPRENILGELHGGWQLAMHTLTHERGPYAMTRQVTLSVTLDRLEAAAHEVFHDGRPAIGSPEIRSMITKARIAVEVLKHHLYRSVGHAIQTGRAGFETSVDKLLLGRTEQEIGAVAMALGLEPNVYLYGRAATVYGGSSQIQRTIIAQRLLGLPR